MADSYSVVAKLSADVGNFTKGMKAAQSSLGDLEKNFSNLKMKDLFKGAGQTLANTGKALTMGVTLPLAGLGTMALKTGADFEKQMNRVSAISGATGDDLAKLEKQSIDLGASSVFGATEVAQSQEMLASAGLTTNEILAATPGIMDLAAVSGGDMALASEAAATAMNQFGLDASESTHVADVFATAAAKTNAETTDMAEALKYAGPVAGALGVSLEETAAAIGIMSDAGIKGNQAGTTMRGALTRLVNPTKKARDVMDELGLSFFDAQGNMLPFGEIVSQLQTNLGGLTQEQKQQAITTMFGQEAMSGMLALLNSTPGAFDDLTASLESSDGSAKDMADTMNSGLAGAIEQLKGSLESAAIAVTETLGPVIQDLAVGISSLVDAFNSLSPAQQENIVKWAMLAAAAGPVLFAVGKIIGVLTTVVGAFFKFGTAIKTVFTVLRAGQGVFAAVKVGMLALSGPIGWVVAGIVALIAVGVLIWKNWDTIKAKGIELWSSLVTVWDSIKLAVVNAVTSMVTGVQEWWSNLKTTIVEGSVLIKDSAIAIWNNLKTSVVESVTSLKNGIVLLVTTIVTSVQERFGFLGPTLSSIWNSIKSIASSVWLIIKSVIITPVLAVLQLVTGDFEGLKSSLTQIWTNIKTAASNIWNNMKNIVVQVSSSLKQLAVTIFNSLKTAVINAFNNLKTGAINSVNNMKTSIINGFNNAKTSATTAVNNLKTNAVNGIKSMVSSIGSNIKQVPEKVRSGFSNAIDAAKSFAKSAVSVGSNLIAGFVKGVANKAKDLAASVGNAVSGAIDKAKSLLGIHSPSKVFRQFGVYTDEGFIEGINAYSGQAKKAMGSMINGVVDVFKPEAFEFNKPSLSFAGKGQSINSAIDHELNSSAQPLNATFNLGNRSFRAFVDDITNTQNSEIQLVETYL